ncbi:MAG: DAK2 domain-containing protein [Chromatiales bacterium]|nr:DAK2 domain-containing protein [Chromatiales bacterium]
MGGHRPAIDHLDGPRLRRALLSAAARLTAERDHLNAINLFPVADGDTGSNLAMTMEAVTAALTELAPDGAGDVLVCAAEAALDGARGNSGAILAQYLLGLAETLGDCRRLEPALLGPALSHAASQARSALADPQPGTMLTLMDAVAAAAVGTASDDLGTLMDAVRQASAGALLETRRMLAVHRAADVEDAGARGFFLLLEGMVAALSGHDPQPELDPGQAVRITPGGLHTPGCVDPARRYCSECVVSAQGIDAGAMRAELEHFADSVVVIGHARRVRVHAHVADPGRLFALAARHGRVSQEKVDDMIRQQDAVGRGQRVAIVTDSGADLPAELCDSLGIHLVPLRVNFGGRSYLDKAGLGSERFFSMLDEELEHPTTSQPAPADYRRLLGFLLDHHEHVIVLSLSSRITGTWQAGPGPPRREPETSAARSSTAAISRWDRACLRCGQPNLRGQGSGMN